MGAASAARWARGRRGGDRPEIEVRPSSPPTEPPVTSAGTSASTTAPTPERASAAASPQAAASSDAVDDLTAIKGLGKVKAAKLVAAGVTSYAQVAAWSEEDIAAMGLSCNTSPGQIKREDWVGQARALAERAKPRRLRLEAVADTPTPPGQVLRRRGAAEGSVLKPDPWVVLVLAVASQEGHHVFQPEAAVPPLADPIERQLTTIA